MGYLPAFIVAFLLDVLVVGLAAKKLAELILYHITHHEKRWMKIVTISGLMVLGMVSCMSVFGLVVNGQALTLTHYGRAWVMNFIFALPLNLLVVGPISRFILGRIQGPGEDFDDDDKLPEII